MKIEFSLYDWTSFVLPLLSLPLSLSPCPTNRIVENGQKTVIRLENGILVSKTVNGVEALEGEGATSAGAIESNEYRGKRKR